MSSIPEIDKHFEERSVYYARKREKGRSRSAAARHRRVLSRDRLGSAMAEFAPALFLLFFFALFPAIDLIGVGLSYSSCMTLNDLQLREAVKVPKSIATDPKGPVIQDIPLSWQPTVVGGMGGVIDVPETEVTYEKGKGAIYVTVTTTCNIRPLFPIPVFPKVPGLQAPFITQIRHSRVLENPAFYMQ